MKRARESIRGEHQAVVCGRETEARPTTVNAHHHSIWALYYLYFWCCDALRCFSGGRAGHDARARKGGQRKT